MYVKSNKIYKIIKLLIFMSFIILITLLLFMLKVFYHPQPEDIKQIIDSIYIAKRYEYCLEKENANLKLLKRLETLGLKGKREEVKAKLEELARKILEKTDDEPSLSNITTFDASFHILYNLNIDMNEIENLIIKVIKSHLMILDMAKLDEDKFRGVYLALGFLREAPSRWQKQQVMATGEIGFVCPRIIEFYIKEVYPKLCEAVKKIEGTTDYNEGRVSSWCSYLISLLTNFFKGKTLSMKEWQEWWEKVGKEIPRLGKKVDLKIDWYEEYMKAIR